MPNLVKGGAKAAKTGFGAMRGGVTNLGRPVATAALSGGTTAASAATPAAGAAAPAATNIASKAANVVKSIASNPIAQAAGAAAGASYGLGQLATGTETGRAVGKAIGDTFPSVKSAMSKVKDYRDNVVAPKLGMKSLSTAAKEPYISNAIKKATDTVSNAAPAAKAEPSSFKQAFAAARKEAGGGKGQFTYKDKQYQTNINPAKGAEKYISASQQKVTSVGKSTPASTTASTSTGTTPGSTSVSSQPAPPSSATAGMSSAATKVGISQTPAGIKTDFGASKSLSPLPTSSTPKASPSSTPAPAPQNPDQDKTKVQAPLPSMAQPGGGASNDTSSGAAKMNAMPKAPEPQATGSIKFKDSSVTTPKTVAESFVTVGDNKYRIV